MRTLFDSIGSGGVRTSPSQVDHKVKSLLRLIDNIRLFGHLKADIYPLYRPDTFQVLISKIMT